MTGSVFRRQKDTNPDRAQTLPGFLFDGELTDFDGPAKKLHKAMCFNRKLKKKNAFDLPQTTVPSK